MNDINKTLYRDIRTSLEGFYRVGVVDHNGNVTWQHEDLRKNLILNQGMDGLVNKYFYQNMEYCVAGTGSRLNKITSSSEISQSGDVVALNPSGDITSFLQTGSGYTNVLQVGDVLQFLDGTETQVISASQLSASVNTSETVVSQAFTIWKTSQVGLHGEARRTSTLLTGVGNVGCSSSYNVVTMWKTYDFAVEANSRSYTEIGVSSVATVNNSESLFNRIYLDTPVTIPSGSQLRATYQLQITATPSASVYRTNVPIGNWPVAPSTNTSGTESLQAMRFLTFDTNGAVNTTNGSLEPYSFSPICAAFIGRDTTPITNPLLTASAPVPPDRINSASYVGSAKLPYVNGSYYIDKVSVFGVSSANYSDLRCMGVGHANTQPAFGSNMASVFLFDQNQTKNNLQTLTLIYRTYWSRVLG